MVTPFDESSAFKSPYEGILPYSCHHVTIILVITWSFFLSSRLRLGIWNLKIIRLSPMGWYWCWRNIDVWCLLIGGWWRGGWGVIWDEFDSEFFYSQTFVVEIQFPWKYEVVLRSQNVLTPENNGGRKVDCIKCLIDSWTQSKYSTRHCCIQRCNNFSIQ